MDIVWVVGIVIALIVVVIILNAAFKGMHPKAPEAPGYTPNALSPGSTPATSALSAVSTLTPAVIAEIDRLVTAGQKLNAIKVLREHTDLGLKDAKDRIDHWSVSTTAPHLAAVSNATVAHSSITPATTTPSSARAALPASVVAEIDRLVAANQRIAAIKLLREHTGLKLKESKNVIDAWGPHTLR